MPYLKEASLSHDATAWARKQKTGSGTAKFVLMLLADQAGSDYSCWPSLDYLAGVSELGDSTIRAATKRLAEQGLIRVYYRHRSSGLRRSCRYQLLVDGPDTAEPETVDWVACRRTPDDDNRSELAEDNRSEPAEDPLAASASVRSERADIPSREPSLKNEAPKGTTGAPRSMRATRIPDNYIPTEEMRTWFAAEQLHQVVDVRTEHEKFMDYWRACPGVKGQKVDWAATWRNWMRTAGERACRNGWRPGSALVPTSGAPQQYKPSTTDQRVGQALDIARKYEEQGL